MYATRCLMNRPAWTVRWAGRVAGLMLIGFFGLFFFGEGPPNPLAMTFSENLGFAALLATLAGYVVAWRREFTGALLSIGSLAAFSVIDIARSGNLPGPYFALFAIPAVLHLAAWWSERSDRNAV